jgi:hypothetical protein
MTIKTQAKILTPIAEIFTALMDKIVPIMATTAANGTNTMPKNRMPKTAKTQANIPGNNHGFIPDPLMKVFFY